MSQEYDTFVDSLSELPQGQECRLTIRDLTPGRYKYRALYVRALVSSAAEQLPDGGTLWLRFPLGELHPQPWKIKIIEELKGLPAEEAG
jgi:hypothetical protein